MTDAKQIVLTLTEKQAEVFEEIKKELNSKLDDEGILKKIFSQWLIQNKQALISKELS